MKKIFLPILVLLFSAGFSHAQIRHVRGIKAVDGTYGISGYGSVFSLSYVKYTSKKLYYKVGPFYEKGNSEEIKYISFGLDAALNYTFIKATEGVYINLLGGVTASSDALSESITLFEQSGLTRSEDFNTVKFGVFAGTEVETFINDKFVFLVNFNQRLMIKDEFGNNRYFLSVGVRYNF